MGIINSIVILIFRPIFGINQGVQPIIDFNYGVKQLLLLIPILLISPKIFGLNGVWASAPSADLLSSILTVIFILVEMRTLNNKEKDEYEG